MVHGWFVDLSGVMHTNSGNACITRRAPHIQEVDSRSKDEQQEGELPLTDAQLCSSSGCTAGGERATPRRTSRTRASVAGLSSSGGGAAGCLQPTRYPGSDLLQFVPEQHFKLLKRSGQLAGLHQHLQHSYGVAAAALEAAAADGKAALVVGPVTLAEQIRKELQDTQASQ